MALEDKEIHPPEGFFQFFAVETIFSGMKEDSPGQEILIQGGIDFLQEIEPAGLQDPGDLLNPPQPIRQVVKDPEPEDSVQGCLGVRQIQNISHKAGDFSIPCPRQAFLGLADHFLIQVHGMENSGPETLEDKDRPRPPAAADLQDSAARERQAPFFHPADLQALLDGSQGVIDG